MDNTLLYRSATVGGITAAVMDSIPYLNFINCLCCLGIALGGVAALFYFRSQSPYEPVEFSKPALLHLGLLTGIIGAIATFILHYIVFKIVGNWEIGFIKNLMENMDELPPFWDEFYTELESGRYDGFTGPIILVRSLILFPLFTYLGVLLGNRFLPGKEPPMQA